MKTITTTLLALFSVVSLQSTAFAATSEITWTDYKKYRDIDSGNESRKKYREETFEHFEKHFAKLAEDLPPGQILKIDITDVDLAGDTHIGGISRMRIIKDIYYPRMNFSYQLITADGTEVIAAEVSLKDMSFMMSRNLRYSSDAIGYEKKMLDDWFNEAFVEYIVKK